MDAVLYFSVACNVSVSHPYLSSEPGEFVKVTLDDLTVACNSILGAMVGGIVATSIQTRLLFRHAIYIRRHCIVRDEVAKGFNYFGRRFGVRRIICGREAFPTPFQLPTVSFRVPTLGRLELFAGANAGEFYYLSRCLLVAKFVGRTRTVTGTTVGSGAGVIVPDGVLYFTGDLNVFLNGQGRDDITYRFVRVPCATKGGTTPPIDMSTVVSAALVVRHRQVRGSTTAFGDVGFRSGLDIYIFGDFFGPYLFLSDSLNTEYNCRGDDASYGGEIFRFRSVSSLLWVGGFLF